jgi:hypothetical protein
MVLRWFLPLSLFLLLRRISFVLLHLLLFAQLPFVLRFLLPLPFPFALRLPLFPVCLLLFLFSLVLPPPLLFIRRRFRLLLRLAGIDTFIPALKFVLLHLLRRPRPLHSRRFCPGVGWAARPPVLSTCQNNISKFVIARRDYRRVRRPP